MSNVIDSFDENEELKKTLGDEQHAKINEETEAIVLTAAAAISSDLERYKEWRESNGKS